MQIFSRKWTKQTKGKVNKKRVQIDYKKNDPKEMHIERKKEKACQITRTNPNGLGWISFSVILPWRRKIRLVWAQGPFNLQFGKPNIDVYRRDSFKGKCRL